MVETKQKQKNKLIRPILWILSYVLLAVIVWHVAIRIQMSPERQQELVQEELASLVEEVGRLIVLPNGETPQIAVINNAAELKKTQDFFVDAEDGDKVLVYSAARKAIIYREASRKIVNVALNISPTDANQAQPVTPKATETVVASTSPVTEKDSE